MLGRGGVVEVVFVGNVSISRTLQVVRLSMNYGYRRQLGSVIEDESEEKEEKMDAVREDIEEIPHFWNIHFADIDGEEVAEAGFLWSLKESVMRNITFSDVSIQSKFGFQCFRIEGSSENVVPSMEDCLM
jgi:hypothetical protein